MKTEQKQLSTVSDPLRLKYKNSEYKVSKPDDQTGEYVSLEVAQEMLEALIKIAKTPGKLNAADARGFQKIANAAIQKAMPKE